MPAPPPKLPLRPNVCIMLFNSSKQLLLAERAGSPGVWQFPQGGVEFDQSIEDNVLREIEEELGLPSDKVAIVAGLKARNEYDWVTPPTYAVGIWRGQSQTFWVVRFLGIDSEIQLGLDASGEQELSQWKWYTPKEIRTFADPRRKGGYEAALLEYESLMDTF